MLKVRVIPLIQLYGSSAVKTIKFKEHRVVGDAISTIKIFSKRMADEMIIVDINASKTKKINFSFLKKISQECIMPLTLGGGIRSENDVQKMFDSGADKIVVNSLFFENINLLEKIIIKYGSQAVVFSMDLYKKDKTYKIFSNSKKKFDGSIDIPSFLKKIRNIGIGEILLNSVERDGTMSGYDCELIEAFSKKADIPIIAAGGCGKSEDCVNAIESGANAVAAGSIFYWVGESIMSVKNYMNKSGINVRLT